MKKFSLVWLEDTGYGKQGTKEKPKRDQGSYVTREQPGSDPSPTKNKYKSWRNS